MYLDNLLRAQFGRPSGLIGSLFLGPFMNIANLRLVNTTIELLNPSSTDAVLDIGFGGGSSLFALADRVRSGTITGVDISNDMVEDAARTIRLKNLESRVDVRCANVERLPFRARTFDSVLTVNSVYYWPHIIANLRETARVLKPHGRIGVGFRSRTSLLPFTETWENFSLYEPQEFASIMRKAGFKLLHVEHRDQWQIQDTVVIVGERLPRGGVHE